MDPSPIMCLPVELLIRILSFLPFKDILACARLSRRVLELVRSAAVLQYAVDLGACGLVDSGQGSGLAVAERLGRLRAREDAWTTVRWAHSATVPVGKKYVFWELCGGVFAGAQCNSVQTVLPSGWHRAFDKIDVLKLQPRGNLEAHDAGARTKTLALGRSSFCYFSADPGQDLLVLVEEPPHKPKVWVIHIRRLSDALVHPRAAHSAIEVPVVHVDWSGGQISGIPGAVETQILGNAVLFFQRRGPDFAGSISVFNWVTGKTTLVVTPSEGGWCCALISWKHLLLSRMPSFTEPRLELFDIHPLYKSDNRRITYILPFGLGKKWRTAACYGPASYSCTSPEAAHTRPFVPVRHPLLLAFRYMRLQRGLDGAPRVDPSSALDMFLMPGKLLKHGRPGEIVEWETWGPQSTRWFPEAVLPHDRWRRNIQGFRVVLPGENTVLDFNSRSCVGHEGGLITQSSRVPLGGPGGRKSIVSSLPYRILSPSQPFASSNVLLDHDQIVCVQTDPHDVGLVQALRVLSF